MTQDFKKEFDEIKKMKTWKTTIPNTYRVEIYKLINDHEDLQGLFKDSSGRINPLEFLRQMNYNSCYNFNMFVNDVKPEYCKNLKGRIENEYERYKYKIQYYCEEAVDVADKIIAQISNSDLNLIYIDPFGYVDIPWSMITKFSEVSKEDEYDDEKFIRRPEMLINLMLSGLRRNKQYPDSITRTLGTDKWEKLYEEKPENFDKIVFDIYSEQLAKYYPKEGIFSWFVESKTSGHCYYLFFVVSHPLAINICKKDLHKRVLKYNKDKILRKFIIMTDTSKMSKGQQNLRSFFKK